MKYLVIGLGTLGRAIAENLVQIGHDVIGVDRNMRKIDQVKNSINGSVALDSTDKEALNTLPLNEIDATFITFGKDFGTSVQTVALLKSLQVNKIIVRSISKLHETVIRAIGVTEIITPEEDFAAVYATQSILGDLFKSWYRITDTHHIYRVAAPRILFGQKLGNINFEHNFHVRLAGIERPKETRNIIGLKQTEYEVIDNLTQDSLIEEGDILILFGKLDVMKKFAQL